MTRTILLLTITAAMLLPACAADRRVVHTVEPIEIKPIRVEPIHVQMDVTVREAPPALAPGN